VCGGHLVSVDIAGGRGWCGREHILRAVTQRGSWHAGHKDVSDRWSWDRPW
jgi:hypothetical protein